MAMLDAGCPVGRHELTNTEWIAIGILLKEREVVAMEESNDGGRG